MKTNKILFEVERDAGNDNFDIIFSYIYVFNWIDDDEDDFDPSAGRFVQYNFPSSFLKLKHVGAL